MRFGVLNEEKAFPSLYEAELLHSSFVCSNVLTSKKIVLLLRADRVLLVPDRGIKRRLIS